MSANSMLLKSPGLRGFPPNTLAAIDQYQGLIGAGTPEHMAVSIGCYYGTGGFDAALANNASMNILIQTPADTNVETASLGVVVNAGGNAQLQIFKAPTVDVAGSALGLLQVNQLSTNTAESLVTLNPTFTDDGTKIFELFIPGGTGGNAIGGTNSPFQRLLAAPSTLYMARVTNISGNAKPVSMNLTMIEVPKI